MRVRANGNKYKVRCTKYKSRTEPEQVKDKDGNLVNCYTKNCHRHKALKTNKEHKEAIDEGLSKMKNSHKEGTRLHLTLGKGGLADIWNNLTEEEQEALAQYTDGDYQSINGDLRNGKENKTDEMLRSILDKASLPADIQVERTENAHPANSLSVAGIINAQDWDSPKKIRSAVQDVQIRIGQGEEIIMKDEAPLSTTTNPKLNFQEGNIKRSIFAPKGSNGMYVDPVSSANRKRLETGAVINSMREVSKESEVLFKPGTKTRLIAIWYNEKEKMVYTLEEIA